MEEVEKLCDRLELIRWWCAGVQTAECVWKLQEILRFIFFVYSLQTLNEALASGNKEQSKMALEKQVSSSCLLGTSHFDVSALQILFLVHSLTVYVRLCRCKRWKFKCRRRRRRRFRHSRPRVVLNTPAEGAELITEAGVKKIFNCSSKLWTSSPPEPTPGKLSWKTICRITDRVEFPHVSHWAVFWSDRWEVIANYMNQHSNSGVKRNAKDVINKAKTLQKLGEERTRCQLCSSLRCTNKPFIFSSVSRSPPERRD